MIKTKKTTMILTEVARFTLGLTFIFSGFVKSIDPYGTAYKVADYLIAFNLSSLSFLQIPISFLLCGFELALGIAILIGVYRKWSSKLMLLTMCFMTPLTLYLAIANPVSDCGCFGDALVISNWETFFKNIVLLTCAIYLVFNYNNMKPLFTGKSEMYSTIYLLIFSITFLSYNYVYDPIIDFRPYKVGVNLVQQMTMTKEMRPIEENIFVYEKDGIQQEFSEDNYPWQDSTWVYVSMETKIIKEGTLPPISGFAINQLVFNEDNSEIIDEYDITEDAIHSEDYTFLIIAPFLNDISVNDREKLTSVINYAKHNNYNVLMLTASTTSDILATKKEFPKDLIMGSSDEKILKTIIRANPSLMVIKNGDILSKWSNTTIPQITNNRESIEELINSNNSGLGNLGKIALSFIILIVPLFGIKYTNSIINNLNI